MKLFENTLICPVCKALLNNDSKVLKCENNHSFDIAKQGYVNLLPVNQKKSKSPGDDKIMLDARRNFLEKKFYNPLIIKLADLINSYSKPTNDTPPNILDAGCGEGYYMSNLNQKLNENCNFLGFDISKYAIQLAARKYKEMSFFVASIKQIPVQSETIDYIVSIFSPIGESEFNRVLKPEGKIIIVSPNKQHLLGLTEIIYPRHNEHDSKVESYDKELFKKVEETSVSFNISLTSSQDIMSLFTMTPYYYSTSKEKSEALEVYDELEVLIDFKITILEKKADN